MLEENYQNKIIDFKELIKKEKSKDLFFSVLRFSLIVASGVCFYQYLFHPENRVFVWVAMLLLIAFGRALILHIRLRNKIKKLKNYVSINDKELDYLNGKVTSLDAGLEYIDPEHLFSNDLDVFGHNSLFQHINRTVTIGGKESLSKSLQGDASIDIEEKQQGVKELAEKLEWRQDFIASGMDLKETENIHSKLNFWLESKSINTWLSPFLLYPLALACFALLGVWLYSGSETAFNWFSYTFGLNLVLVLRQFKTIKSEYEMLSGISKSLMIYGELIELIEKEDFQSELLKNLKSQMAGSHSGAGKALKGLSRILNGFDQLNNVVALVLTNGLYHYHLHTLKNLFDWKKKHGKEIFIWLDKLSEFDELISIANYSYNHPEYSFPTISDEPIYEAKKLGHPLINAEKRIDNSIDFSNFQFMVLTGSNMSGKSTFLKSLGLNLVLAKIGSPTCADLLNIYPYFLMSSMKLVDSISKEESYFQAEVMRLKSIHTILQERENCFLLLDEILRGTNSDDKRSGTRMFLQKIASYSSTGVIATHDVDIADLVDGSGKFEAGYFESKVIDGELSFDYTLREGVCRTPNATDLMKAQGII